MVTFTRYSNYTFHYIFKAEFVTHPKSKSPVGKWEKFCHLPSIPICQVWVPPYWNSLRIACSAHMEFQVSVAQVAPSSLAADM